MTTEQDSGIPRYDAVVIGGGPAGATAAHAFARASRSVLLIDRPGRIKPCGGAIPPRLIRDFDIPDEQIVARANCARIVSPSSREIDMPIEGGYVGMVDREHFDEWLRERAQLAGADRASGRFDHLKYLNGDRGACVYYTDADTGETQTVHARVVVGADGANSKVAKQCVPRSDEGVFVAAYHEIVQTPDDPDFDGARCDIHYRGDLSPDFYSWVFPHGDVISVGTGTAQKGYPIRRTVERLREELGLSEGTIRREGAPIPLKPLPRWEDGRCVVLAGDAAGVVAPASGEGIYYAMVGGETAAEAADAFLETGNARALTRARKTFMKAHGRVFWVLGLLQKFWYSSDKRRERFVTMCDDPDVQYLTWTAYMNKELVQARPGAHMRIFMRDVAHLLGMVKAT